MRRLSIVLLSVAVLAGCRAGDNLQVPKSRVLSTPAFQIADGAHGLASNPDFFFLPPMVPDPSRSPNFDKGAFNGNLNPTVDICEVNATTEQAAPGASCKAGGYLATIQLTPKNVQKTEGDGEGGHEGEAGGSTGGPSSDPVDEDRSSEPFYHTTWKLPDDSKIKFFRITVHIGAKTLGFADVEKGGREGEGGGEGGHDLKNVETGAFVHLDDDGLSINFRIEKFALCSTPGKGPCASAVVDLAAGGTVTTTLPGSTTPTGIVVPMQSTGSPPVNLTISPCANMNNRAIDLPTFGPCVTITSDPPLPGGGFSSAAKVFICDAFAAVAGSGLTKSQDSLVTLHRLDGVGAGQTVKALPHASAPCAASLALAPASVGGFLRALAHGQFRSAGSQVLELLGPKPLYAYRFLDQGGGGSTDGLSDFQFALPAKMLKVAGDGQTGTPGMTLPTQPTVQVTDLHGDAVKGATVKFGSATSDGTPSAPVSVTTGADGKAQTPWKISTTAGPNSLTASGRGIGGVDNNGPRTACAGFRAVCPGGVDPFQPLQSAFDGGSPVPAAITLLTGSQTFAATGGVRVAGVGANSGNEAANVAFTSGDLKGTITRLTFTQFNTLAASPAALRAAYDVIIITWASDPALNVNWNTVLLPYIQAGGGVIYDGDPNNVGDLSPVVTAVASGPFGTFAVTATVPGLTNGINGSFVNDHVVYVMSSWSPSLSPFLTVTVGEGTPQVVGLYGRFGAGCVVLTGPDQDFHAVRGNPADLAGSNQYNLLLNEIRTVRTCPTVPSGPGS